MSRACSEHHRLSVIFMNASPARIYLSPPHMGTEEFSFVREAFETNWIAPVGPHVDAFERDLVA